jgi:Protein of unknown function DUF86
MQRDVLLLTEMIDAAEQAQALADGVTAEDLAADRQRRDALLWNFTVLGEAAGQLSDEVMEQFPAINWQQPARLRNGSSTATGPSTWTSSTPPPSSNCQSSPPRCAWSSPRKASRPDWRTRRVPGPGRAGLCGPLRPDSVSAGFLVRLYPPTSLAGVWP